MAGEWRIFRRFLWTFRVGIVLFGPLGAFLFSKVYWLVADVIVIPLGLATGVSYLWLTLAE